MGGGKILIIKQLSYFMCTKYGNMVDFETYRQI